MLTRITNSKLFSKLKDRKYRNLFIAGEVRRTVPFQLRALRAERKWTQAELGKEAEMPQTVISRIENGDAASLSIKTLLKLASAFDVALVVRFEPIDRLIHWVDNLSPNVMAPMRSGELLTEMEQPPIKARAAVVPSRSETPAHHLRLLESSEVGTSAVQRNLAFSSPSLVVPNTVAATSSQHLAVTETLASGYRATA